MLPPDVTARVSVEQASTFGWAKYVGTTGHSIGMHTFGASAPLKDLTEEVRLHAWNMSWRQRGASANALRCQRRLTMTINAAMSDRMTFCNP